MQLIIYCDAGSMILAAVIVACVTLVVAVKAIRWRGDGKP